MAKNNTPPQCPRYGVPSVAKDKILLTPVNF